MKMMMTPELPEDLEAEILCRVPATSLQRFRFTCKRWNLLFNNRRFIKKQQFYRTAEQSLILMLNKFVLYSLNINLRGVSSVEMTDKLNLITPHSRYGFRMPQLSPCDGLLLCVYVNNTEANIIRLMVWNPCTGQTKWIQHRTIYTNNYTLGSYQDSKSGNNSYKILSHMTYGEPEFEIFDINSNSWRILDVTMDCDILYSRNVSLKGKTYWFAKHGKEKQLELGLFLISFDYTTEKFERLPLPCQCHGYRTSLSVVREEKLSVLLQHDFKSKTEIWVSNKIGETKVLSWILILTVDLKPEWPRFGLTFLVDEEKKVVMYTEDKGQDMLYMVGEDNKVKEMAFGGERLFSYVPSLTRI